MDFMNPANPSLCRVIEVWRKESKPRYRCHDYNNGDDFKIDIEDCDEIVDAENQDRLERGLSLGMKREDIPLIEAEWFMDDYWHFYYLSPFPALGLRSNTLVGITSLVGIVLAIAIPFLVVFLVCYHILTLNINN
mgnify:CR=1 FL=1